MLTLRVAVVGAVGVLAGLPAHAAAADGRVLAQSLIPALGRQAKIEVTRASCPRQVDARKGRQVTCQVTYASGDRTPVRVRFRDSSGKYTATPVNFLTRAFEDQIEAYLRERGTEASVRCPAAPRRVRRGDRFTCTGTDEQGDKGIFDIEQTGRGFADFKLRR